jgi:hypothetical protein
MGVRVSSDVLILRMMTDVINLVDKCACSDAALVG